MENLDCINCTVLTDNETTLIDGGYNFFEWVAYAIGHASTYGAHHPAGHNTTTVYTNGSYII